MFGKLRLHARRNAVAYIALFFALAGGAYASGALAPANSVNSQAIINGQVKQADLANGAVSASKVAPNSLTGAQIKESSLATVPQASLATNATRLGGAPASAYTKALTINGNLLGSGSTTVLAARGLTLTASCDALAKPSSLSIKASSTSVARFEVNTIRSVNNGGPTVTENNYVLSAGGSGFQVLGDQFTNSSIGQIDAGGTFVYAPDSGAGAVTGTFHYYMQNGGGECDVLGNAVPSP